MFYMRSLYADAKAKIHAHEDAAFETLLPAKRSKSQRTTSRFKQLELTEHYEAADTLVDHAASACESARRQ